MNRVLISSDCRASTYKEAGTQKSNTSRLPDAYGRLASQNAERARSRWQCYAVHSTYMTTMQYTTRSIVTCKKMRFHFRASLKMISAAKSAHTRTMLRMPSQHFRESPAIDAWASEVTMAATLSGRILVDLSFCITRSLWRDIDEILPMPHTKSILLLICCFLIYRLQSIWLLADAAHVVEAHDYGVTFAAARVLFLLHFWSTWFRR